MRSMNACFMSLTAEVVEGRVVDQDLDRVGAPIHQALHGDVRQQVGEAARAGSVVAGEFVGEQQAGVGGARLAGFQAEIGIQQDGAGVRASECG